MLLRDQMSAMMRVRARDGSKMPLGELRRSGRELPKQACLPRSPDDDVDVEVGIWTLARTWRYFQGLQGQLLAAVPGEETRRRPFLE
jgi:hypothetical protein